MSDFLRAAVGLFAAIAPTGAGPVFLAAVPDGRKRLAFAGLAGLLAFGLLAAAALAGGSFVDWLDISPENFQLAAAAIMAPHAANLMWRGQSLTPPEPGAYGRLPLWLVPLALPLLAGPASLAASISYSTRFGEATAMGAAGLVLALAVLWVTGEATLERLIGRFGAQALARLNGALLAVIAVEMALDGVHSV